LLEGFVGGQDNRTPFIALADGLKKQIGAVLVDGQITDFIQDEDRGVKIFSELGFEAALFLSGRELVNDVDGVGKEHRVVLQAGGIAQCGGQMGFAQADSAQENDVGFFFDEAQAEEVLHRQAVDFFRPVPAELFESFQDRKAGLFKAAADEPLAALVHLALDEALQVAKRIPLLGSGLLRQGGVMFPEEGQLEIIQVLVEQFEFHNFCVSKGLAWRVILMRDLGKDSSWLHRNNSSGPGYLRR